MTEQKEQVVYLEYNNDWNAFVVADEIIEKISQEGKYPDIRLKDEDIRTISNRGTPSTAPTIGFLMGREKGHYSIDYAYAKTILDTGAKIKGLDYDHCVHQVDDVDGLCLPGGAFDNPTEFYVDYKKENNPNHSVGKRYEAYFQTIVYANTKHIPKLGVCAGAQMIWAIEGNKLIYNPKNALKSKMVHKSSELDAHVIIVEPDAPKSLFEGRSAINVNSRHNEGVSEYGGQIKTYPRPIERLSSQNISEGFSIYAKAVDGLVEAFGNKETSGCQWHPETLYVKTKDKKQLAFYQWLTDNALKYKRNKEQNKDNIFNVARRRLERA